MTMTVFETDNAPSFTVALGGRARDRSRWQALGVRACLSSAERACSRVNEGADSIALILVWLPTTERPAASVRSRVQVDHQHASGCALRSI
jgi:hypothetical protein